MTMTWITTKDRIGLRWYVTAEGYAINGDGYGRMRWTVYYDARETIAYSYDYGMTDTLAEAKAWAEADLAGKAVKESLVSSIPNVVSVTHTKGIAGQYALTARVMYADEPAQDVTFVGNIYDGPIVMCTTGGMETFVSSAVTDRLGSTLDEDWVRAFFA